jgi:hypothetical protein
VIRWLSVIGLCLVLVAGCVTRNPSAADQWDGVPADPDGKPLNPPSYLQKGCAP